ncbi:MAG: S-layer homology domain-containing protein [Cyanobacteriota bacterium]
MNRSFLCLVGSVVFASASLAIPAAAFSVDATPVSDEGIKLSQNTQVSFPDIPQNHWAGAFISRLAELGIIQGYPDGRFQPNKPVTKAEFAAMIAKAFDKTDEREAINFRDISTNYWAYEYVREAYRMGFFETNRRFSPTQKLSRLDILVALTRGLDYSFTGNANTVLQAYSDVSAIPSSYRSLIAAATERGLVVNYPNVRSFNPTQLATRAEVAAFIYQALANTGKVTSISSDYIVGSAGTSDTQTNTNTEVTTTGTNTTGTNTTGTNTTGTNTTGTNTTGTATQTGSAVDVVTLSNGYRITYLGMTPGNGTSTWRYRMEELPEAQDLSNWVLGLPSCATVVNATPKGEVVNPDPNAKISGIKWQPGGGFTTGEFEVTLNGQLTEGTVDVAAKGPDVERGQLRGPSCGS